MEFELNSWALLGYVGAFLNALIGGIVAIWAFSSYQGGQLPWEVASLYVAAGLTGLLVTAPILGCLATIANTVVGARRTQRFLVAEQLRREESTD